jgi:hypothetical protein
MQFAAKTFKADRGMVKKLMRTQLLLRQVAMLLALCCLTGCSDRYEGGMAPSGTASERDEWGIAKMGTTYRQCVQWVKNSEIVKADVGEILAVAPIGNNPCSCAFTDGCNCYVSLEVVGQKGTGRIEMRSAFTDASTRRLHFAVGIWEFGGKVTRAPGANEP